MNELPNRIDGENGYTYLAKHISDMNSPHRKKFIATIEEARDKWMENAGRRIPFDEVFPSQFTGMYWYYVDNESHPDVALLECTRKILSAIPDGDYTHVIDQIDKS